MMSFFAKTVFCSGLFFFTSLGYAQQTISKWEMSFPLHPGMIAVNGFYGQLEYFGANNRSTTLQLGFNGPLYLSLSTKSSYWIQKIDVAKRWYTAHSKKPNIMNFKVINLSFQQMRLKLDQQLGIPSDSLEGKGFVITPELMIGRKKQIKRFTINSMLGLRYDINLLNKEKFTKNPQYWAPNSWDNPHETWQENRSHSIDRKTGLSPVIYVNLGYRF